MGSVCGVVAAAGAIATGAFADGERAYTAYYETTGNIMRGVHAHWTDETWTDIPCPDQTSYPNRVNTDINNHFGNGWTQLGYQQYKWTFPKTGCQPPDVKYYWEWNSPGYYGYNKGTITSVQPRSTRDFSVTRGASGCAAGVSYCWRFAIDSTIRHTCCGDFVDMPYTGAVSVQTECVDDNFNSDCPATGLVDPIDDLKYKDSADNLNDWSGKDADCVEYTESARGKWTSDTSVKGGYNVNVTNSLTVCY